MGGSAIVVASWSEPRRGGGLVKFSCCLVSVKCFRKEYEVVILWFRGIILKLSEDGEKFFLEEEEELVLFFFLQ